jgi:hypothetical protein
MPPRCSSHWFLLIVCGLPCGPLACTRIERAQECQQLAARVNAKLDAIEQMAPRPAPSGSAAKTADGGVLPVAPGGDAGVGAEVPSAPRYRQMAKLYLELSKELAGIELRDAQLGKQVEHYSRLMKRTARALERLADASASANHRALLVATNELRQLEERQRTASQQIDQICLRP